MHSANHIGSAAEPLDYFALLKPRVMWLVVFTAAVGMYVSPIEFNPIIGTLAILCTACGAGSAGCLNMWYEAEIDAKMVRTRNRPIPSGKISRQSALTLGLLLAFGSVSTLLVAVGIVPAFLLAATIFYYVVIYTIWFKPSTPQNVVIGGVSGSLPPVIGWTSTGADIFSMMPWFLFAIIFLWTPPHSWALALWKKADYADAGIPMLPSTTNGIKLSCDWSLFYSALLFLLALGGLIFQSGFGILFDITNVLGSLYLLWHSVKLKSYWLGDHANKNLIAKNFFRDSIYYMVGIFVICVISISLP